MLSNINIRKPKSKEVDRNSDEFRIYQILKLRRVFVGEIDVKILQFLLSFSPIGICRNRYAKCVFPWSNVVLKYKDEVRRGQQIYQYISLF
jgi:hypothetical protein